MISILPTTNLVITKHKNKVWLKYEKFFVPQWIQFHFPFRVHYKQTFVLFIKCLDEITFKANSLSFCILLYDYQRNLLFKIQTKKANIQRENPDHIPDDISMSSLRVETVKMSSNSNGFFFFPVFFVINFFW